MSKLIATVIATIALFGGAVALAAPASADCGTPIDCLNQGSGSQPLIVLPEQPIDPYVRDLEVRVQQLTARLMVADATANDFRILSIQQAALIEDLRAQLDRREATIARQRAVIQRLRDRLAR